MDNTLIGQNRSADIALVGNLSCTFETLNRILDEGGLKIDLTGYSAKLREEESSKKKQVSPDAGAPEGRMKAATLCRAIGLAATT